MRYDTQSIDHLLKQSGGHPYLLQIICSNIVDLCREMGKLIVDPAMVERAVQSMFETSVFYLHDLWRRLSETEKSVMVTAATILLQNADEFSANQIGELKPDLSDSEIARAIVRLRNRGLIAEARHGNYRFTMEALARWILKEMT